MGKYFYMFEDTIITTYDAITMAILSSPYIRFLVWQPMRRTGAPLAKRLAGAIFGDLPFPLVMLMCYFLEILMF